MGHFFEGIQKHMENKNKGNENKIIIGDFNCIMSKMDRDGERSENPDPSELTCYDRSFGKHTG